MCIRDRAGGVSYVDFIIYEDVSAISVMEPQLIDNYENLQKLKARVEAIPQISEYLASDAFLFSTVTSENGSAWYVPPPQHISPPFHMHSQGYMLKQQSKNSRQGQGRSLQSLSYVI
eukprot:TRINITY_DN7340_c0_g1_i4.p1 TRINITY_DN7340_c0_g1~~TRINITY_DN7340_c0_g1_i4.p1  ORF type:complete len:117 (-),score=7.99 TRINITY_DN7340_c0_g1_i4:127-477(-)